MKFDTPDEVINESYAENFARTNRLYYLEELNITLPHPIVFPRWVRPDGGYMYSGTFLGMIILAGSIAKALGTSAIPFVTPVIAVLFVLVFYSLIKSLFNKHPAVTSSVILALFPVFLYYASRTMFHTVLFLFFVLLGVWLYVKAFQQDESRIKNQELSTPPDPPLRRGGQEGGLFVIHDSKFTILYYLSALSFGLALFIRFADVWWVVLTMIALFVYRKMDLKRDILFWLIFLLSLFPILYLNKVLYGNWLDFGYSTTVQGSGSGSSGLLGYFLPFGFHPRVMWNVVVNVLLKPYWWFFVIGLAGYVLAAKDLWKANKKTVMLFTVYCLLFTVYLISFYGSWKFSDSVDPNAVAISSSYYRYFLPLFLLIIPFVAYLLIYILAWIRVRVSGIMYQVLWIGVIGIICFVSFQYAYLGEEGLLHVRRQVLWYRHQVKIMIERGAGYNDLFLARRGEDKILFPEFPKVVNIDYIDSKLVEESLKKYKGAIWESHNGVFEKRIDSSGSK